MIVFGVVAIVLCLPLAGTQLFRLIDNQLLRETERELIAQGAVFAAIMAREIEQAGIDSDKIGPKMLNDQHLAQTRYQPLVPKLDLGSDAILPPRPKPVANPGLINSSYLKIGEILSPIILQVQKNTLAGFRILDFQGIVIAGRNEVGLSLAHVAEVMGALSGAYHSVIRQRISDETAPPLASISRGANIRVFVAVPVVYKGNVGGVVYLSRTPNNLVRVLYQQWWKVLLAGLFMLMITTAVAFIVIRTIKNPIDEMKHRTRQISRGDRSAIRPLEKHGSREMAELSQSLLLMSERFFDRADYINTFATHVSHELRSPLTSIQGAAELLRDSNSTMNDDERQRFLKNIIEDAQRLTLLLERLRALANSDNPQIMGVCNLNAVIDGLRSKFPNLEIGADPSATGNIAMSNDNARIIFSNLFDNAQNHGAISVEISSIKKENGIEIVVQDDGNGISAANAGKIFDLFFTTRRQSGGTGMGLRIVQSMLLAHRGKIEYLPSQMGARFHISIPAE